MLSLPLPLLRLLPPLFPPLFPWLALGVPAVVGLFSFPPLVVLPLLPSWFPLLAILSLLVLALSLVLPDLYGWLAILMVFTLLGFSRRPKLGVVD
jgi:hypothetical protein